MIPIFRRRFLVLAAVLLLAAMGGGYLFCCLHLPVGSGPAGPKVSAEPFGRPWTNRKVLLLGIGDSVTAGFGVAGDHSFFARLARNPPDELADMSGRCLAAAIGNLSVRNLAVSGSNSLDHLAKQIRPLATQPDDVLGIVVMTTGGNDLIHDYGRSPPREGAMYGATVEQARPWIAAFRDRLAAMVEEIKRRFPGGCEIFIADIYDPSDGKGIPWNWRFPAWRDAMPILAQYNAAIHEVAGAAANVHLVPMHDGFLGHGYCCSRFWDRYYRRADPTFWYGPNIEDPTDRGYDAIRRLFLLEMVKVFGIR